MKISDVVTGSKRNLLEIGDEVSAGVDPDTVSGGEKKVPGTQTGRSPEPSDTAMPPEKDDSELDQDAGEFTPDGEPSYITTKDLTAYSKVSNDPYVTDYDHDAGSDTSPDRVVMMDQEELEQLLSDTKAKMKSLESGKRHGLYKDRNYVFYQKLSNFVSKVIKAKS